MISILHRDELTEYLKILGERLTRENLHGEIILTGGAAMCLVHTARDMTKDIDALYEPKNDINRLAESIADEYGLPKDWLNDSVKDFVNEKVETKEFAQYGNLIISAVTPDYLLAMKLMSSRVEGQDYNDIKFLFRKLRITESSEAQKIIERFFPVNRILPKTQYVIEQCLDEIIMEATRTT